MADYGLSSEDALILTAERTTADYLDAAVKEGADPKTVANWMLGDLSKMVNEHNLTFDQAPVKPSMLAAMIALIDNNTISGKIAKKVIVSMWESGKDPKTIVEEEGLVQITDTAEIEKIVREVIAKSEKAVADYKAGNKKAVGAIVGGVMKATQGKANPGLVNQLIGKILSE